MAIVVKDRVKVTFTTTGTADFTLGAAASGYQSFAAIGNTNFTYYAAVDPATGDWEVGYGQYLTAGPTLTRNTVLSSSAAGAKVSFGSGSKDVFCTYPSEKAIYEEFSGNVLIDGGPITVVGTGVTTYTTFGAALAELYANINSFAQMYAQNLNNGSSASTDIVAYNDLGDGTNNFIDMGIASSNYTEAAYPIFTPGSGYLYNDGGELIIGSATDDVVLFAGGVALADEALRIDKTSLAVTTTGAVNVGGALDVNGAADVAGAAIFGSTVTLNANPTLALQAATKQYVDNQVTAGLHIHDPVRVETTGNLTATYVQGGTTFNITAITGTDTVTTSVTHSLAVNDQIWLYTSAGNGLSTNTAYFVYSIPAVNQLTLSLTFGGSQITGLTNAAGLTYATRANSGVGATLTNSGTQAALTVDGINLSTTNRVMVRLQTAGAENGVYTVTTVGSVSTNWVLTRATDSNQVNPADPQGLGTGDYYFTQEGVINAGDSHVLTTEPNTMIIGYTTLTYTQFSGSVDYTGGTNIDVTGQVISLTGTVAATNGGTGVNTVTTGNLLYGSGTNTWSKLALGAGYRSLVVNAAGTQVEWNAVALNQSNAVSGTLPATSGGTGQNAYTVGDTLYSGTTNTLDKLTGNITTTKKFLGQTGTGAASAAPVWQQPAATDITGLAASATTDTTNAANITTGVLPSGRISGSYTGLTGTGALAAGSLATGFTAVTAPLGGTGQTSYAVGDLLYASTTTALSKLADVAVGNALISGGVGSAPSYGKIGLATHVSGTLPTANGGTNLTGFTANGVVYASSASALATGSGLQFDGTNLGVGVTPSAWNTSGKALQVGTSGALESWGASNQVTLYSNAYRTSSAAVSNYINNGFASAYVQLNGQHIWYTAASGTAGNTIAFTQALTLDASGNLGTIGDITIGSAAATSRMFRALEIGAAGNNAGIAFGSAGAKGAIYGASGTGGLLIVGGTGGPISFGYASGDASLTANYLSLGAWSTTGLGIGTSSPSYKLDVSVSAATAGTADTARFYADASSSAEARILFGTFANPTNAAIGGQTESATGGILKFYTETAGSLTEKMRITSAGGVSFGATGSAYGTSGQVLTSAANAPPTWTTATSANTASAIVQRDGSGNFTAGTITAALSGTATYVSATQQVNLIAGKLGTTVDINAANDTGSFSARGDATYPASMSFHRTGAYAINMGLSTANNFVIGGWSATSNAFSMTGTGGLTLAASVAAPLISASNGIYVNSQTVAASYTIATGTSGMSSGPITIASGQTVTVASGSRWVVL
jgi:hypothetical protein